VTVSGAPPFVFPTSIRQKGASELEVTWNDGHASVYPVRMLRIECPCAGCVDEMSGAKRLDSASVSPNVRPVRLTSVGRYAVNVVWNDMHQTGIYTFEYLRRLCPCAECARARGG
jgi:DUF971 family protein